MHLMHWLSSKLMKKIFLPFLLLICNLSFGQVDLNLGLKAYYPFSGNANDASGNGYNGVLQGNVQLTTDRFGNANSAYQFDGNNDGIIVTDNGQLSSPAFSTCYCVVNTFENGIDYNRAINEDEVDALCQDTSSPETTNIINNYTPVLALDICNNSLQVEDASKYNPGDTVLLIQMKGAVIDSSNTANFGTITDYKNSGNYEFNIIKDKSGNKLSLANKLERTYDIPNGKV